MTCANWTQKYKSIGLEIDPLQQLLDRTNDFLRFTELLLIECGQARRHVRTLFQVLSRMAQQLAEPQSGVEPNGSNSPCPTKEDMDDFVSWIERRQSLELQEVTDCIGDTRIMATDDHNTTPTTSVASSIASVVRLLAEGVKCIGAG